MACTCEGQCSLNFSGIGLTDELKAQVFSSTACKHFNLLIILPNERGDTAEWGVHVLLAPGGTYSVEWSRLAFLKVVSFHLPFKHPQTSYWHPSLFSVLVQKRRKEAQKGQLTSSHSPRSGSWRSSLLINWLHHLQRGLVRFVEAGRVELFSSTGQSCEVHL